MTRRTLSLPRAMQVRMPERIAHRLQYIESLLRICQLVLIAWIAVLGAQWAAKAVVRAATALVVLLH